MSISQSTKKETEKINIINQNLKNFIKSLSIEPRIFIRPIENTNGLYHHWGIFDGFSSIYNFYGNNGFSSSNFVSSKIEITSSDDFFENYDLENCSIENVKYPKDIINNIKKIEKYGIYFDMKYDLINFNCQSFVELCDQSDQKFNFDLSELESGKKLKYWTSEVKLTLGTLAFCLFGGLTGGIKQGFQNLATGLQITDVINKSHLSGHSYSASSNLKCLITKYMEKNNIF
jgi:hypothetical protein